MANIINQNQLYLEFLQKKSITYTIYLQINVNFGESFIYISF